MQAKYKFAFAKYTRYFIVAFKFGYHFLYGCKRHNMNSLLPAMLSCMSDDAWQCKRSG